MFTPSDLAGPLGGALAGAFAVGAVSGWGFNMKIMSARITEVKADFKDRIDELKADCEKRDQEASKRITAMDAKLGELNEFLLHGMERQLAQIRSSSGELQVLPPSVGA